MVYFYAANIIRNAKVEGSIPFAGTNQINGLRHFLGMFYQTLDKRSKRRRLGKITAHHAPNYLLQDFKTLFVEKRFLLVYFIGQVLYALQFEIVLVSLASTKSEVVYG